MLLYSQNWWDNLPPEAPKIFRGVYNASFRIFLKSIDKAHQESFQWALDIAPTCPTELSSGWSESLSTWGCFVAGTRFLVAMNEIPRYGIYPVRWIGYPLVIQQSYGKAPFFDFGKPPINDCTWTIYQSMDWFKGNSTGNHCFSWIWEFPVKLSLTVNQSIDRGNHFRFPGFAAPVSELRWPLISPTWSDKRRRLTRPPFRSAVVTPWWWGFHVYWGIPQASIGWFISWKIRTSIWHFMGCDRLVRIRLMKAPVKARGRKSHIAVDITYKVVL